MGASTIKATLTIGGPSTLIATELAVSMLLRSECGQKLAIY